MFSVENVMGLEEVAMFKVTKLLNIYMRGKKPAKGTRKEEHTGNIQNWADF